MSENQSHPAHPEAAAPRRRGRPPGSKNKPRPAPGVAGPAGSHPVPATLEEIPMASAPDVPRIPPAAPVEPDHPRNVRAPVVEPQVFAYLLLDISASMTGEPIAELIEGLHQFVDDVRSHPKLPFILQLQVDVFSSARRTLKQLGAVFDYEPPAYLATGSGTALGEALNGLLDDAAAAREAAQAEGTQIRHTFVIPLSDGEPNGDPAELTRACGRIHRLEAEGVLSCYPVGVGPYADLVQIGVLSKQRPALRLADTKDFKTFFAWLFASLRQVSQARVGERAELPNPRAGQGNPLGWATGQG